MRHIYGHLCLMSGKSQNEVTDVLLKSSRLGLNYPVWYLLKLCLSWCWLQSDVRGETRVKHVMLRSRRSRCAERLDMMKCTTGNESFEKLTLNLLAITQSVCSSVFLWEGWPTLGVYWRVPLRFLLARLGVVADAKAVGLFVLRSEFVCHAEVQYNDSCDCLREHSPTHLFTHHTLLTLY